MVSRVTLKGIKKRLLRWRHGDIRQYQQNRKNDLEIAIDRGSKLSVASACFSIYAYQALKKQLNEIDELRFIFTSPAFVTEKAPKEKRELEKKVQREKQFNRQVELN